MPGSASRSWRPDGPVPPCGMPCPPRVRGGRVATDRFLSQPRLPSRPVRDVGGGGERPADVPAHADAAAHHRPGDRHRPLDRDEPRVGLARPGVDPVDRAGRASGARPSSDNVAWGRMSVALDVVAIGARHRAAARRSASATANRCRAPRAHDGGYWLTMTGTAGAIIGGLQEAVGSFRARSRSAAGRGSGRRASLAGLLELRVRRPPALDAGTAARTAAARAGEGARRSASGSPRASP